MVWRRCMLLGLVLAALPMRSGGAELTAWLPEQTLVAFEVPSLPALTRAFEASPFYQFYGDPAGVEFFQPLRLALGEVQSQVVARGAVEPERLARFFSGAAVLAGVATPGGAAEPIEWVLIFEHNGDEAVLEALRAGPRLAGVRVSRTDEAGVAGLTRLRLTRAERATIPGAGANGTQGAELPARRQRIEEYQQFFGPTVGIHAGVAGEPARWILERMERPAGEGFAAPFAGLGAALPAQAEARVLINLATLDRLLEGGGKNARLRFDPRALRLDQIRAAAALDFRADRLALELLVEAPQPPTGVAELLFLGGEAPPRAAHLVPPDVLLYSSAGYPLAEAWTKARALLGAAAPALAQAMNAQLDSMRQASGIDFERGLFGSLGDGVVRFVWPGGGGQSQPEMTTLMLAVRDRAALSEAIEGLLRYVSEGLGLCQVERSGGARHRLWTVRPGRPGAPATGQPWVHLALTEEWLMGGMRPDGLREVLRRMEQSPRESLATSRSYIEMMERLPAGRYWEGFTDLGGVYPLLEAALPIQSAAKQAGAGDWSPVDEARLPGAEVWARYFGSMGAARTIEGDRLKLETFILYPAAERR